jgi:hypothetical protein
VVGETEVLLLTPTVPTVGEMLALVAPVVVQDRVDEDPLLIDVGLAVNAVTTGRATTVTVVVLVAPLAAEVAVRVYVPAVAGAVQVVLAPLTVVVGEKLPPVAVQLILTFEAPVTVSLTETV